MNADVFTSPPDYAFMLGKKFTIVQNGKIINAISVSTDVWTALLPLYAILIQFLFSAAWRLITSVLLVSCRLNDRVQVVGLVSFWNSGDPISATWEGFKYLAMAYSRKDRRRYLPLAVGMSLTAATIAGTGIAVGIKYGDWIQLGTVAPAEPSKVFWPYFGAVTSETMVKIYSQARPGVMRALGSAEAGEHNSKLQQVTVSRVSDVDSTVDEPQEQLDYSYTITAQDFGLQTLPDLSMDVQGSCRTDYSWAHRRKSPTGYTYDYYYPWGDMSATDKLYRVATEADPIWLLDFVVWLHPDIDSTAQARNRSFAFLAATAMTPSTTPSSDAWYKTEGSNGSDTSLGLQYVVRSSRPVLNCWETTDICTGGRCYTANSLGASPVPHGLAKVLETRLNHPMITRVAQAAGVSSIKSYVGSASGTFIDAGASGLHNDMTRLILAGYLASTQVFQEVILASPAAEGAESILQSSPGRLLDGAAAFVVRTNGAVALQWELFLLAPIFCAVAWLAVFVVYLYREHGKSSLTLRGAALSAAQLYRQLDEAETKQDWELEKNKSTIPYPPDPATGWGIELALRNGPRIHFIEESDSASSPSSSTDVELAEMVQPNDRNQPIETASIPPTTTETAI